MLHVRADLRQRPSTHPTPPPHSHPSSPTRFQPLPSIRSATPPPPTHPPSLARSLARERGGFIPGPPMRPQALPPPGPRLGPLRASRSALLPNPSWSDRRPNFGVSVLGPPPTFVTFNFPFPLIGWMKFYSLRDFSSKKDHFKCVFFPEILSLNTHE